jgi:5-methylcytosine-specific restriction endonuclease McrA
VAKPRDYKKEAQYEASPEQVANRVARNRARRQYQKEHGDLPRDVELDHIKPLSKGGSSTSKSNVRAVPASANRSFSRTKTGALKSQISKRESKK